MAIHKRVVVPSSALPVSDWTITACLLLSAPSSLLLPLPPLVPALALKMTPHSMPFVQDAFQALLTGAREGISSQDSWVYAHDPSQEVTNLATVL